LHKPERLFGSVVGQGMRCLDFGAGGGFVSMGLARLVGPAGRVVAADCQQGMLDVVGARARREGHPNVEPLLLPPCCVELPGPFDVAVMFYVMHEVPDARATLQAVHTAMRPGGQLFLAEPPIIVSRAAFDHALALAESVGFQIRSRPRVVFARAAWLVRP
jgi:2-polyprenyl-3-methyl-5-hydroxy-6-metoxy-1,4-benzoquinol methylase